MIVQYIITSVHQSDHFSFPISCHVIILICQLMILGTFWCEDVIILRCWCGGFWIPNEPIVGASSTAQLGNDCDHILYVGLGIPLTGFLGKFRRFCNIGRHAGTSRAGMPACVAGASELTKETFKQNAEPYLYDCISQLPRKFAPWDLRIVLCRG